MSRYALALGLFLFALFKSSAVMSPKLIHVFNPMILKATQSSPPYIAYQILNSNSSEVSLNSEDNQASAEHNYQIQMEINLNDQKSSFIHYDGQILASYTSSEKNVIQLEPMRFSASYSRFQNVQARRMVEAATNVSLPDVRIENENLNKVSNEQFIQQYAKANNEFKAQMKEADGSEGTITDDNIDLSQFSARDRDRLNQSGILSGRYAQHQPSPASSPSSNSKTDTIPTLNSPVIEGNYQISGGVGITNEHHVELTRVENGIVKDSGQVNLQDGKYKIQVSGFAGELVAQVVHNSGRVEGQTRVKLEAESLVRKSPFHFSGPILNVSKVGDVAIVDNKKALQPTDRATSSSSFSYASGMMRASAAAKTTAKNNAIEQPIAKLENFYKGSSTIVYKKEDKTAVSTMALVESDQQVVHFETYKKSFIEGTVAFINDFYAESLDAAQPIIIGRVQGPELIVGQEIGIRNDADAKVFYFDEFFIPQKAEKKLYANGMFIAFLNQEGLATVDLKKDGQLKNYINTIAELNKISLVQVLSENRMVDVAIRSYDAFNGYAVYSQVEIQGLDEIVDINNEGVILKLNGRNHLAYAATSDDNVYMSSQYEYKEDKGYIHLPRIPKEWLNNVLNQNKKNIHPQTGMIVGFVQDDDFEVFLPTQLDQNQNPDHYDIIYFNSEGHVTPQGVAGGGFILINVLEKIHEVMVQFKQSEVVVNKVTPVQMGHIFTHNFSLKNL